MRRNQMPILSAQVKGYRRKLQNTPYKLPSPPGMKWKAETDSTAFRVGDFEGNVPG
jgi:hypothetical protein